MKNKFVYKITFVIFCIALLSSAYYTGAQEILFVNASDVNIRVEPGLDSEVSDLLQKGDKLYLLKTQGEWYYVEYQNGLKRGWIFQELVSSSISSTPTEKPVATPVAEKTPTPVFKPEDKIAFATGSGLKIINYDGSGLQTLTDIEGDNFPVWSKDGTKISFINYREGRTLYTINFDGTGRKKVSENRKVFPNADWSNDSKNIAFASESKEDLYYINLFTLSINKLNTLKISTDKISIDQNPVWSPDDSFIAFNSRKDKNSEIYIINRDGSGETNISNSPAEEILYDWTEKGILFTSDIDSNFTDLTMKNPPRDIYLIKSDGSELKNLTQNASDDYSPAWSFDEKMIVYLSDRDSGESKPSDIFILYPEEEKTIKLVTNIKGTKSNICWSPDNQKLLFQAEERGINKLYVLTFDGMGENFLVDGYSPSWCPGRK